MYKLSFTILTLLLTAAGFAQFNLSSPADGTNLTVEGLASKTVDIQWTSQNTLTGTIAYTWHLDLATGNFSSPIISVPSNNMGMDTMLTLDLGTINAVLDGAGVGQGQTANLKWTVTASNGSSMVVSPDSFLINLTRGATIGTYDLVFPSNSFSATVEGDGSSQLDIRWESAGNGATYKWFLDLASGNFSNPVVNGLMSNNMGMDTVLTLDFATIDAVLAGAGVMNGQTANLKWKVHAYGGPDSLPSTSEYTIDLTKGVIIGDFDLVFPTNNFAATIEGKGDQSLDIQWNNAGMGITYEWQLDAASGDFSNPIVALASNNMGMDTVITLDFNAINGVLAGAMVNIGSTANLKWRVVASGGNGMRNSTSEFNIDLTRGAVINPFMLVAPADGFAATIDEDSTQSVTVTWASAGEGATYKWFLDLATGDYSNAIVNGLDSDNGGMDTTLTLSFKTIYDVLAGAGVNMGQEAKLMWKIHAYGGTDSIPSGNYKIDLTRGTALSTYSFDGTNSSVSLWPNPVDAGNTITVTGVNENAALQLMDITGKQMLFDSIQLGSDLEISTEGMMPGMYILTIDSDVQTSSLRFIVE